MSATFDIEADVDDELFGLVITISQAKKRGEPSIGQSKATDVIRLFNPNAMEIRVNSIKCLDKSESTSEYDASSNKSRQNSATKGKH